jgi:hypothetical protein
MSTPTDISTGFSEGTNSVDVSMPASSAADSIVLFVAAFDSGSGAAINIDTPSGWTADVNGNIQLGNNLAAMVFTKVGGTTTPVTVTFDQSVARAIGWATTVSGAKQASIINISDTNSQSSSTSHALSSITTTVPNTLLFGFWAFIFQLSPGTITKPSDMSEMLSFSERTKTPISGGLLAYTTQTASGSTGIKTALTTTSANSVSFFIAVTPHDGPSIPVVTFPTTGVNVTNGATPSITWNPSTSPTAAQATIQYKPQYTYNGTDYFNVLGGSGLTSAGVTTAPWTPTTNTNAAKVRVLAHDPAIAVDSLDYGYSGTFNVVSESTPPAPSGLSPNFVYTAQDKASVVALSWVHGGGLGNPQTAAELLWATNSAFSGATTVSISGSLNTTSVNYGAQADGQVIYFKVRSTGVSLQSAYSSPATFVVASKPATPNITAPTVGSPPTTPLPTITYTQASAFVERQTKVEVGGGQVYIDDPPKASTALSFTSPYSFANNVAATLSLRNRNIYGLFSDWDSETVTPSYAVPDTPILTATALPDDGNILFQIANPDTPRDNELHVYYADSGIYLVDDDGRFITTDEGERISLDPDPSTAWRVAEGVAVDGSFRYFNAPPRVRLKAFARAINPGTEFYSDSEAENVTLNLTRSHLHPVTKDDTTMDAYSGLSISGDNEAGSYRKERTTHKHKMAGQDKPRAWYGQNMGAGADDGFVFEYSDSLYVDLMRMFRSGKIHCYRSHAGKILFGYMTEPKLSDDVGYRTINFSFIESAYDKAV